MELVGEEAVKYLQEHLTRNDNSSWMYDKLRRRMEFLQFVTGTLACAYNTL